MDAWCCGTLCAFPPISALTTPNNVRAEKRWMGLNPKNSLFGMSRCTHSVVIAVKPINARRGRPTRDAAVRPYG